nr:hypothetical protein [Tanacetum cinerariifolium]
MRDEGLARWDLGRSTWGCWVREWKGLGEVQVYWRGRGRCMNSDVVLAGKEVGRLLGRGRVWDNYKSGLCGFVNFALSFRYKEN